MLSFDKVNVSIAGVHVLRNITFALAPGATAALIGRNGAGKTTTLRAIMGLIDAVGDIRLGSEPIGAVAPHRRPALGIGYAPEDRRLFTAFTVEENILLPARVAKIALPETRRMLDRAYAILPELPELAGRPAGSVSGRQGKMVALGRALMLGTRLLILDEPLLGLRPGAGPEICGGAAQAARAGPRSYAAGDRVQSQAARNICGHDTGDRARRDFQEITLPALGEGAGQSLLLLRNGFALRLAHGVFPKPRRKIIDRRPQTVVECHTRFPPQLRTRQRNVGLALLRVVLGQRQVHQFRLRAGLLDDQLGQLSDGEFAGVAEIDRAGDLFRLPISPTRPSTRSST